MRNMHQFIYMAMSILSLRQEADMTPSRLQLSFWLFLP